MTDVEKESGESASQRPDDSRDIVYIKGWRLFFTTAGLLLSLNLANIESTIVSTSLVSITNDLNSFNKTNWIVTGYLITYTGFMTIWSKLSDSIGRKAAVITANIVFLAFSLGCGLSQTANQLIICAHSKNRRSRRLHLTILCAYEIETALFWWPGVSLHRFSIYHGSYIWRSSGSARCLAMGVLYEFPPSALAVIMLMIAMPVDFDSVVPLSRYNSKSLKTAFQGVDYIGCTLLLSGSLLIVTVLNEKYTQFEWSSGGAIALLALSGVSWISFFMWEWLTSDHPVVEPIFPKRWWFNRPWMGMLMSSLQRHNVYLPQRLQVLSAMSPLASGTHTIAYSGLTALANFSCSKGRIPFIYFLLAGTVIHTIGVGLLSSLPETAEFPARAYGYQVLSGFGMGTAMGILVLATPFIVEPRDIAIATGAITQFRFLGGAIGVGIASNILNGRLENELEGPLSQTQLATLPQSPGTMSHLKPGLQEMVRDAFGHSYTIQYEVLIAFAAVQLPATLTMFRRGGQFIAS